MKKNQLRLSLVLFVLGVLVVLGGALAKLEHWPYANFMLVVGLFLQAFTIVLLAYYFMRAKFVKPK